MSATTYRAIEVTKPGEFSLATKPLRDPGPGQIRIRVEACGVCHSDAATVDGLFPIEWPRVPGHEIVGIYDASPETLCYSLVPPVPGVVPRYFAIWFSYLTSSRWYSACPCL